MTWRIILAVRNRWRTILGSVGVLDVSYLLWLVFKLKPLVWESTKQAAQKGAEAAVPNWFIWLGVVGISIQLGALLGWLLTRAGKDWLESKAARVSSLRGAAAPAVLV